MDKRITLLIFTLSSIACSPSFDQTTDQVHSGSEYPISKQDNVAKVVNNFGYKLLLTMMKQNKDENIVISPTSVAGLLAMTLLGTIGKTHKELAAVLGFSEDIIKSRTSHEQFGALLQALNSNETASKTLYADAIFVDTNAKLRDQYKLYLGRVYNGDALSVDFKQTLEVKDLINEWVDVHTEGRIENFLQKTLPVETKAVLLSALYFRGQWEQPFLAEYTKKMPFQKPSNAVMADLMLNMGSFNYIQSLENDLHMIAMNYNDSTTTMYAIKPLSPNQVSLYDLMDRLDFSTIDRLIDEMDKTKCVVRFPKMDLKIDTKLETPLKALGLQSLFTPGQANFALMVDADAVSNETKIEIHSRIQEGNARGLEDILNGLPNPGLHVDSVLHDVKLTINEYGTEAVAATSGVLARTARLFYADSPFHMFIRNEQTKLITFSAVIYDPTA